MPMSHFNSTRCRTRAGLLLLLFLPILISGCGTQAQNTLKVQEDLSEALRHAQTDPTDKAARQWADRAIAVTPSDANTYLGSRTSTSNSPLPVLSVYDVFAAVGDNPAVADYMTQAVKKFPADERGFQLLAQTQGQLGQTAAQQATSAQLVALLNKKKLVPGASDFQAITTALAQAYFDAGDTVNGAATYKKAIQAYPNEPNPLNGLAYAYAVRGTNLPEALALAQKAVTLAQKNTAAGADTELAAYQDTLGWVQYHLGRYPEAEQSLLPAANALPRLAEVRYHLGLVYAAQGKYEAARAELGHAVLLAQGYTAAQAALDSLPKNDPSKSAAPKAANRLP